MEKLSEKLDEAFVLNMKKMLGADYKKYEEAINGTATRGLRVNTKKIGVQEFLNKTPLKAYLKKIDYASDGFVLNLEDKLGGTIEHLSGEIYLQEPSSMVAVCSSGIENEDRPLKVLDLCAAPGGKTSQIASRISEDSLIISNEIIKSRASILYSNIERQGFKNVIILNENPEKLKCFQGFFDYVFVDAPCSGEGMFRKNPETINEWSEENVKLCANRQKEILDIAVKLVAEGGKLIYSTCTFNESEDENIVDYVLDNYGLSLEDVPESIKRSTMPSNIKHKNKEFVRKFYPFTGVGEGQFIAVFKNVSEENKNSLYLKKHYSCIKQIGQSENKLVKEFSASSLTKEFCWQNLYRVGDNIYYINTNFDGKVQTALESLKFVSLGVRLGSIEKGRFEPNHNIFMAFSDLFKNKVELTEEEKEKYLHGEEIVTNDKYKGYGVVTRENCVIGGVKISNGRMKNLYPKGMRV